MGATAHLNPLGREKKSVAFYNMLSVFRKEASLWVAAPNRKKMREKNEFSLQPERANNLVYFAI